MRTNANYTNEILGAYLMNNNTINVESLADQVDVLAINTRNYYEERLNTRRKIRNIAIDELMFWINTELKYSGYPGYYATNAQVMKFDREHGGSLEKVLDIVEKYILITREEMEG